MYESNTSFCCFWQDVVRNAGEIIAQCIHGVDHDPFRCARVRTLALESDGGGTRAPRLLANLTESSAINCVSEFCTKAFYIKLLDTCSHFFVRSESDRNRPV